VSDRGSSLFRREALAHHAGRRLEGDVLRASPIWLRCASWFFALVALGTLAGAGAVMVPVRASAPAMSGGAAAAAPAAGVGVRVFALLPESWRAELLAGGAVFLLSPAGQRMPARLEPADGLLPPAVQSALWSRAAAAGWAAGARAVEVSPLDEAAAARRSGEWTAGSEGRVEVVLGREPLLTALFPDLRRILRRPPPAAAAIQDPRALAAPRDQRRR